jgi:hypothetical protein
MGRFTVYIALLTVLVCPVTVQAQEPTPTTVPLPYDFEAMDYNEESDLENLELDALTTDPGTINSMLSTVVTVWSILDDWAGGGVLGYFVVFLLGLVVIRFAARYVYQKPIRAPESRVAKEADEDIEATKLGKQWSEFGRELNRRKHLRF